MVIVLVALGVAVLGVAGTNLAALGDGHEVPPTDDLRAASLERVTRLEVRLPTGEVATGLMALPESPPSVLVVLCHALGGSASDFRPFMERLAGQGVASVAMEYRGARGSFNIHAGVHDTVAATEFMYASHPTIQTAIIYGFSMGGAVSGLTVAMMPPGTFDHWLFGAGVANLSMTWDEVPDFRAAIEAETGGTPANVSAAYRHRSVIDFVAAIVERNLTSIVLVHALADPVVSFSQAEAVYEGLRAGGQPVTLFAVGGSSPPWGCDPANTSCADDPMALVQSHGAGSLDFVEPALLTFIQGPWRPTEARRILVDGTDGPIELP